MTADLHRAVGGVEQAGGHLHQRRLAAAVVADEGNLGAGVDLERQRFERRPIAVGLGQLASRQFGHAGVLRCCLV